MTIPDSVHWLSGFDSVGYLWLQALVVDHRSDEPLLLTRTTEEPGARDTTWLQSFRFYDIAHEHPAAVLADTLRERGLDRGRIGIDLQALTLLPAQ